MPGLIDLNAAGAQISASTTSARAAITLPGAITVKIYNPTGVTGHFKAGDLNVTATTADNPVGSGAESYSISPSATHVACILASGTGTIDFRFSMGGE